MPNRGVHATMAEIDLAGKPAAGNPATGGRCGVSRVNPGARLGPGLNDDGPQTLQCGGTGTAEAGNTGANDDGINPSLCHWREA